jgi:hypothetical protein
MKRPCGHEDVENNAHCGLCGKCWDGCCQCPHRRPIEQRVAEMREQMASLPVKKHKPSPLDNYTKWWLGKLCRRACTTVEFRRVKLVEWIGNPSMFYGCVKLTYKDGTHDLISDRKAFKPRKSDVEVLEENEIEKGK